MNFISNVFDRRDNPPEDDKKEYLSYYRRLRALFSDISYPLLEYLKERDKDFAHEILYDVEKCFSSSNLQEHFRRKPFSPTDYIQYKHIVEEFVGYLKYKN